MIFLSLQTAVVVSIIIVVAVQYALALFCLLKLAYLDITKKEYVLWNLFILLIFFIGDAVFLVYWFKVKDEKRIPPFVPSEDKEENDKSDGDSDDSGDEKAPDTAPESGDGKAEASESGDGAQTPAEKNDSASETPKPKQDDGRTSEDIVEAETEEKDQE